MNPPLRKKKPDGTLYKRSASHETLIAELSQLSRDDILARCAIKSGQSGYVPSECLLHLMRQRRNDNSQIYYGKLYNLLYKRVLGALPRLPADPNAPDSLKQSKIREAALHRFNQNLSRDFNGYDDRLDFFEIKFDAGVVNLRRDVQEKAWNEENRSAELGFDDSGELSPEVEEAAAKWLANANSDENDYRSRLDAAIEQLEPEQIRIITMLRFGVQMHSSTEPYAITIANTLSKSEKTIRLWRDKAIAKLKTILGEN